MDGVADGNQPSWIDDAASDWTQHPVRFRLREIEFACAFARAAVPGCLTILKSPELVTRYVQRLAGISGSTGARSNIVEVGIRHGGGAALIAELVDPRRLVALELDSVPPPEFDRYVATTARGASVHPYYGVDQADVDRVLEIVSSEFGDEALDLVIDDASHLYEPTRRSFQALFPLLRPGGIFIIEDWAAPLVMAEEVFAQWAAAAGVDAGNPTDEVETAWKSWFENAVKEAGGRQIPVSRLVLELVLLSATSPHLISSVEIDGDWAIIHRGEAELDRSATELQRSMVDRLDLLAAKTWDAH